MPTVDKAASLGGLYDGFEGYRTPSEADFRVAFESGLVAIDTNVLLHLYRYDDSARDDLFSALSAVGDRLFVPNQVIVEFWRNRESAARDKSATFGLVIDRLGGLRDDSARVIREWANRLAIDEDVRNPLLAVLREAHDETIAAIEDIAGEVDESHIRDTTRDPVLKRVNELLVGKVGQPLAENDHLAALKEAKRRIEELIPPGYKDAKKGSAGCAGDYLVWCQILREVKRRGASSVTVVTGDAKEDWWRYESKQMRGPRIELCQEARLLGTALYMLRPQSFLRHAETVFELSIHAETVAHVERAELAAERPNRGWSAEAVGTLMERLASEGPVQHAVVLAAGRTGGFVSRDEVYRLGNYREDRTLRGFTRPTNRIAQQLKDEGVVSEQAPDVLETVYDPTISYVHASGFRVSHEIVENLRLSGPEPETTGQSPTMD